MREISDKKHVYHIEFIMQYIALFTNTWIVLRINYLARVSLHRKTIDGTHVAVQQEAPKCICTA